jgi:capsular polysaccharide transport system permease protein
MAGLGEPRVALRDLRPTVPTPKVSLGARLAGLWRDNKGFAAFVLLPTLLAGLYLGLIAANRFESEARFLVRSPSATATSQLASLVQGSSIIRSSDDAYAVHAYMRSRDAVQDLGRVIDLKGMLSRYGADLVWRPNWGWFEATAEAFWRHVQRFVDVDYDHSTGISRLRVTAFDPNDARLLAEALLSNSEVLINRLSARAQGDAVRTAEAELVRARKEAVEAQERITAFRVRESVVDPNRTSQSALETIARLALEVSQTNALLAEVRKASPQSTQIATLTNRVVAFEDQIDKERRALAGNEGSLATMIAEYERLVLEREFAERSFTSALASLESARLDSQRQRMFLERISNPQPADEHKYPARLVILFAVFALSWMLYSIGVRILRDMREHAEA